MLRLKFKDEITQKRIEADFKKAVIEHIENQIKKINEKVKNYIENNDEKKLTKLSKLFFNKERNDFSNDFKKIQNLIRKKICKKNIEENAINRELKPYYDLNIEEENIYKEITKIYEIIDWDEFRKDNIHLFRQIIENLNIKVCPYCGRNYIEVIELENETKIPAIDHYYPKKGKVNKDYKYKYLTLSLYNLIPACHICNSRFKGEKIAKKENKEFLYPYKEEFENNVVFQFSLQRLDEQMNYINALSGDVKQLNKSKIVLMKKKLADIKLDELSKHCGEITKNKIKEDYITKCINSNKLFHIEEIYNQIHKQNAIDLINKVVWFRKNYIRSLCEILKLVNKTQDSLNSVINSPILQYLYDYTKHNNVYTLQIEKALQSDFEILFGRWLNEENDLKEPLSKFYRDIYNQIHQPSVAYELLSPVNKEKIRKQQKSKRANRR